MMNVMGERKKEVSRFDLDVSEDARGRFKNMLGQYTVEMLCSLLLKRGLDVEFKVTPE
jgi:hypothetical protein